MDTSNDDYDNPWKIALVRNTREFFAIFCPGLEAAIDWSVDPSFHDQELRKVTRDAKTGLRRLDELVKVRLLDGGDMCIHLELQLCRERGFGQRLFVYCSRLLDRYACPVASIAVLADRCPTWRPCAHFFETWGTRVGIEFTLVKLLDFVPAPQGQEANFFAYYRGAFCDLAYQAQSGGSARRKDAVDGCGLSSRMAQTAHPGFSQCIRLVNDIAGAANSMV